MCLVLGLRFDSKVAEALVGVVVANEYLLVDTDKSGCPTMRIGSHVICSLRLSRTTGLQSCKSPFIPQLHRTHVKEEVYLET